MRQAPAHQGKVAEIRNYSDLSTLNPTALHSLTKMVVKFDLPFTQTSHVAAFICTLLVVVTLSPLGTWNVADNAGSETILTRFVRLVHFAAFATWLGTQVWVTFIAGKT